MSILFQVCPPKVGGHGFGASRMAFRGLETAVPLVSAVMVTRGNVEMVRSSLASFRAQTWPNKELVVVCAAVTAPLRELLNRSNEKLIEVPGSLTLGNLRNIAVSMASGDYICTWDDDDLYDPSRVAVSMQVIIQAGVAAVFLKQLLIWWPERDVLALSGPRPWEGSMLAKRAAVPIYPSMAKSEDFVAVDYLCRQHAFALLDAAKMYCYRITGENTWDEAHFNRLLAQSPKRFEGKEKEDLLNSACFSFAT
jgi:glycosyltransferase involved in cell wall biosynthesis